MINNNSDNFGVSKVIAIILMVLITVLLAGLVSVTVFDISNQSPSAEQNAF